MRNFSLVLAQKRKMYAIKCNALGKLENLSRISTFNEDRATNPAISFLPETFLKWSYFWANTILLNVAMEVPATTMTTVLTLQESVHGLRDPLDYLE